MGTMNLTGAEIVADFISRYLYSKVFLVTGGACAFIVDAIGEHPDLDYVCFQHEQAAAMAADAVWRTNGQVGVTLATSGPGATNLITGIACSWFDSIPSFHITGQVNQSESAEFLGVAVRQAGFQETDIVGMVRSITKYAKRVHSIEELCVSLMEGLKVAKSGRMGPVLIDIPMDIQKAEISISDWEKYREGSLCEDSGITQYDGVDLIEVFETAHRPLVLLGGGLALSGQVLTVQQWCEENSIPYVASWSALPYVDRSKTLYFGAIGVYGSRIANWAIQACDYLVSLGSRLDNRQRTANPKSFAPFAKKIVLDIDKEELKKFDASYKTHWVDLSEAKKLLPNNIKQRKFETWLATLNVVRSETTDGTEAAALQGELNPYDAVKLLQTKLSDDAIIVSDCGANLCWVYQSFLPSNQLLFTAAGNSPMGYSLPAAIGACISNPERQVACFIGDGGFQMNIQELQTISNLSLPIKIFIQNNFGYGIIKQFQDSYFGGRHHASGQGYSVPSFSSVAKAYGLPYKKVSSVVDIDLLKLNASGAEIIDIELPHNALITPKVEMNRFLHDQFPYRGNPGISRLPYSYPVFSSEI